MKPLSLSLALFGGLMPLRGEEAPVPQSEVEIPGPIANGAPPEPAPKPEPIAFKILGSRTTRVQVTEAPEMPDLPPIKGAVNVTVQKVEDPGLPDPPPPLPPLPPTNPAVIARMEELRETYRGMELVFLSATVYDHSRTLLRIYPNGKPDGVVTAWSNIDFKHFGGFSTFRVKEANGVSHDCGLIMGIGDIDTRRWKEMAEARGIEYAGPETTEIPALTDIAIGGPSFVVVEGERSGEAMDTLAQIHDLYRKEGRRMEEAYHARVQAYEERKAFLLAHPPKPKDVKVQVWKRSSPLGSSPQNEEGGTAR